MSIGSSMIPEFDQEIANTRKTLERIPDELFDWKPHEKSFSFMQMANHLARMVAWGSSTLTTESLDLDPEMGQYNPPPPAETISEVLAEFDGFVPEFRKALSQCSDEALMKPWTLLHGGKELFTLPRIAVIRGMILNHIIHHRGQLTVYLRLNDLPLPALYGPSADEDGM